MAGYNLLTFSVCSASAETFCNPYVTSHSHYCKKDIAELGKALNRVTKVIKGLEYLPYEEKLKGLECYSLEKTTKWQHDLGLQNNAQGRENSQKTLFLPLPNTLPND